MTKNWLPCYSLSMNIQTYKENRFHLQSLKPSYRSKCLECWQPSANCLCPLTCPFDPKMKFVILTHPAEARKRIATGRMSHKILKHSLFFRGYEFAKNTVINQLIADTNNNCFVLFPGPEALDISEMSPAEKKTAFSANQKKLVLFVMDGTWSNTGKMFRLSPNLKSLPQIRFTPKRPSQFIVRKQPKPFCLSTIEAIHFLVESLGPSLGFPIEGKRHDNLLKVFQSVIQDQIQLMAHHKTKNNWKRNQKESS